jgi:hypothetical protein
MPRKRCPCGRLSRNPTLEEERDGLAPVFCVSCARADDQVPSSYDFSARENIGEVELRARTLAYQIEQGSILHARAQQLLHSGQLEGEAYEVWSLFVIDGLSERAIAAKVGRGVKYIYNRYLGPFREICGYPVRPYRSPRHRRKATPSPR